MRLNKTLVWTCFLLFLSVPIFAQQSVVAKYRVNYPTPLGSIRSEYESNTIKLLKQIAAEVHGGILKKPSGNNCLGYSCDFICFSDGRGFDVLQDSEGLARPVWNGPQSIDRTRCELVQTVPVPTPNPPPTGDTELSLLKEIRDLLKDIRSLLQ